MKRSLLTLVTFSFALPATSATVTKGASGTELTDGASWAGGVVPGAADTAAWADTSNAGAQNVGSAVEWNRLIFANASELTLSGAAITLNGASTGGSFDILGGNASGARSIENDLIFTGLNSNSTITTGSTQGRLKIVSGNGGSLTLGNVSFQGGSQANDANLWLGDGHLTTINGALHVDGQVGKGFTGTLVLNGANTMGWFYLNNGTVLAGHDQAFGANTIFVGGGGGNATFGSANASTRVFANKLDLTTYAATLTFGQTTGGTGKLQFVGDVDLGNGERKLATVVDTSFSGVVSGTNGGITKTGAASLTLTGANTYGGVTGVNEGVLFLGHDAALGASQLRLGGGTVAAASASARTISTGREIDFAAGSTIGSATTGHLKFTDNVSLGGLQKTATIENSVTEFAGVIRATADNSNTFQKSGPGELILSGDNTYTRPTLLHAGTLTAGHVNAFGAASKDLTVTGGLLQLGGYDVNKDSISLNGGKVIGTAYSGTVNIGADAAISGLFSGTVNSGTDAARAINTTGGLGAGTLVGQGLFSGGLVNVTTSHSPGHGIGAQSFHEGLGYGENATLTIEIASDGLSFDSIHVIQGLTFSKGVVVNFLLSGIENYADSFWDTDHSFAFLSADTTQGGFHDYDFSAMGDYASRGTWSLDQSDPTKISALWTAIPEPSVALLGALGLLAVLRRPTRVTG